MKKPKMAGTSQDGVRQGLSLIMPRLTWKMIVSLESGEKHASAWGRSALKGHKTRDVGLQ